MTPEYRMWNTMLERCYNPNSSDAKDYRDRGIRVFPPWRKSFVAYRDYIRTVLGPRPGPGFSIDRIDNNGHYEPGNLRWADWKTQNRNSRWNHRVTAFGQSLCIAEWAEKTGLNQGTLWNRLVRNLWPPERALSTPVKSHA
jgi:hypothetical protein